MDSTAMTMSDFIVPEWFDLVVEASLKCTGTEGELTNMKHPSFALKLGYDLENKKR